MEPWVSVFQKDDRHRDPRSTVAIPLVVRGHVIIYSPTDLSVMEGIVERLLSMCLLRATVMIGVDRGGVSSFSLLGGDEFGFLLLPLIVVGRSFYDLYKRDTNWFVCGGFRGNVSGW